ncbi:uncharacterized protein LOC130765223 [Actinidia eriantha]|uniref:uncharacterized protein LOC130765223 n=1 Tax=Actinidia eriantha TaxID=165200 RepID=UPI00258D9FCD|nr:uncharacterized protein LOC130765223 [Actinidia eriantha]
MITHDVEDTAGAVLDSQSLKLGPSTPANSVSLNGKYYSTFKSKGPSDGTKCSYCGNLKHTRDTCFKLHGYPDWWHELQAKRRQDGSGKDGGTSKNATSSTGKAAIVSVEPQLSLIPAATVDVNAGYSHQGDNWAWY